MSDALVYGRFHPDPSTQECECRNGTCRYCYRPEDGPRQIEPPAPRPTPLPQRRGLMDTTTLPAATSSSVPAHLGPPASGWTREQVELVKRTVAKGASDDELRLFQHVCERTGLDPFVRQIHAVKRWDSQQKREVMAIQTGIDGLRLIAERTGRYAPGSEPTYTHDANGAIVSATAYVKKLTQDGTWHEVGASALYSEYVQTTRSGEPTRFWQKMPHVMLAKVAEALALRRAFPAEMSGVYSHEEMSQADDAPPPPSAPPQRASTKAAREPAADALSTLMRDATELAHRYTEQHGLKATKAFAQDATGKDSSKDYDEQDWRDVVTAFRAELDGDGDPAEGSAA